MKTLEENKKIEMPKKESIKPSSFPVSFARHETFHPRYGWLKKGYDAVLKDKEIFSREDASVRLGVGKNMVTSIRYWGLAFKVFEEFSKSERNKRTYKVTDFGSHLLDNSGWDPYLEDPASLWLLHRELLKSPCIATAWWFTFNEFHHVSFNQEDLLIALRKYKDNTLISSSTKDSSLIKDINCLIRMYVNNASSSKLKEDTIDSPFTELMLLENDGDSRHVSFILGKKHTLPDEIIVHACLDYVASIKETAATISVSRLLYEVNSPGLIFKLSEASLCEAIENVSRSYDSISLSESGGLVQFNFGDNPKKKADKLLKDYYKK